MAKRILKLLSYLFTILAAVFGGFVYVVLLINNITGMVPGADNTTFVIKIIESIIVLLFYSITLVFTIIASFVEFKSLLEKTELTNQHAFFVSYISKAGLFVATTISLLLNLSILPLETIKIDLVPYIVFIAGGLLVTILFLLTFTKKNRSYYIPMRFVTGCLLAAYITFALYIEITEFVSLVSATQDKEYFLAVLLLLCRIFGTVASYLLVACNVIDIIAFIKKPKANQALFIEEKEDEIKLEEIE